MSDRRPTAATTDLRTTGRAIKVVSLDPGRTTGYAHGIINDGSMLIVTGQLKLTQNELYTHLVNAHPDVIVCERFDYRNRARKGLDMYPRELIGVVELFTQQHELDVTLKMQTPAQAKGYYTDQRLKLDHLYKMGKPHANDAARHILYWYVFGSGFQYNTRGYESGR